MVSINEIVKFFETQFDKNQDPDNAKPMEAYMKGIQPFYGIKTPLRKEIYREFKQKIGKKIKGSLSLEEVHELVEILWNKREREYRYTCIFLLEYFEATPLESLPFLQKLIISGNWWDLTDSIAPNILGELLLIHHESMKKEMKTWIHHENFWIRRAALLSQLKLKNQVDVDLMSYCIKETMHEKEFFIQKAIGWLLRQYSYTDKEFVRNFIDKNRDHLSKLSIREGSKYL